MPTLYVLCGPQGSGKTTWAINFVKEHPKTEYVSRDAIRFARLHDNPRASYFSYEDEVYEDFVDEIAFSLKNGYDVIADATHLTRGSRRRLFTSLDLVCRNTPYDIVMVAFEVPKETCIAQNAQREGLRKVPIAVIEHAFQNYKRPDASENAKISRVEIYGGE